MFGLAFAFLTTFWSHSGACLSAFTSHTCTLPASVTAANVVELYGAHAMSPGGVWWVRAWVGGRRC